LQKINKLQITVLIWMKAFENLMQLTKSIM
jgi:hypothetical protein